MPKYLNKFKRGMEKLDSKLFGLEESEKKKPKEEKVNKGKKDGYDDIDGYDHDIDNDLNYDDSDKYDIGVQPSQKPESFHHFILENQYKDLERSIRGFKDVFDKETQQWKTKRKSMHCFTDEEAEDILRTAQSHLATDIKLGYIRSESFALMMDAIYKQIAFLFERIAEYRYGRYGSYEMQGKMKEQNLKIFLELFSRIQANYSRSIQGAENKATHNSVQGQESLQNVDRDRSKRSGYY